MPFLTWFCVGVSVLVLMPILTWFCVGVSVLVLMLLSGVIFMLAAFPLRNFFFLSPTLFLLFWFYPDFETCMLLVSLLIFSCIFLFVLCLVLLVIEGNPLAENWPVWWLKYSIHVLSCISCWCVSYLLMVVVLTSIYVVLYIDNLICNRPNICLTWFDSLSKSFSYHCYQNLSEIVHIISGLIFFLSRSE